MDRQNNKNFAIYKLRTGTESQELITPCYIADKK